MSAERWYCVSRQGFASLCPDEADAHAEVVNFDRHYPEYAPHRAVRLVDAAEVEALRADAEALRSAIGRTLAMLAVNRDTVNALFEAERLLRAALGARS